MRRGYQMLLDFTGPRSSHLSLLDALAGRITSKDIEGKVVFVGPLAPQLEDYLRTPRAVDSRA